jgi:uncharacterized protein YcbK (DUF882 family)
MMEKGDSMQVQRRRLLIAGLAGAAGVLGGPGPVFAATTPRRLAFHHLHTGERLSVVYAERGATISDALRAIDLLLRDFRTGDVHHIDVALLDILSTLYDRFGQRGRFEVISGFRSSRTNAALREASDGVAKNSLHLHGRAIDVRLTGIDTGALKRAAVDLGRGGVGYYPKSDFVHLDTGRPRTW